MARIQMSKQFVSMKNAVLFIISLYLMGCNEIMDTNDTLISVDQAFSDLSKKSGMNTAFIKYIADDCVLLRPNNMPFVGKESIANLFKEDDSGFTLTWEPKYAEIADSGELGFTYGTYLLNSINSVQKGTYVSIWKKDKTGNWKLALDSGNEGVGK